MHRYIAVGALLLVACGQGGKEAAQGTSAAAPRARTPSVRITMDALHRAGGVPPGWKFTPPPGDPAAGRRAFADAGCGSCHAVGGESAAGSGPGPDLAGMGSHHPPEYFVESIVNPDAVVVEGQGYVDAEGHSTMPSYPDMTLAQLGDVVAYLQSLTDAAAQAPMPPAAVALPAAPAADTGAYYVEVYDVKAGRLAAFEEWFRTDGAARFLAYEGLRSIETYVDTARPGPSLVTVWGFTDMAALDRFLRDPDTVALGAAFDAFIGPHPHLVFRSRPVYRAATLSAP